MASVGNFSFGGGGIRSPFFMRFLSFLSLLVFVVPAVVYADSGAELYEYSGEDTGEVTTLSTSPAPNSRRIEPAFSVDISPMRNVIGKSFAKALNWKFGLLVAVFVVLNVWSSVKSSVDSSTGKKRDKRTGEQRAQDRVKSDFDVWAVGTGLTYDDYRDDMSVRRAFYKDTYG